MFLYSSTPAAGRRRIFSSPSKHSANERLLQPSPWKATTLWNPSVLQRSLCSQQLPPPKTLQIPPFLSFVLWTFMWFTIRPHVPNCSSLLFLNKPILLEDIWLPTCLRSTKFNLKLWKNYSPEAIKNIQRKEGKMKQKKEKSRQAGRHVLL